MKIKGKKKLAEMSILCYFLFRETSIVLYEAQGRVAHLDK